MTARRRRGWSESEQTPLIVTSGVASSGREDYGYTQSATANDVGRASFAPETVVDNKAFQDRNFSSNKSTVNTKMMTSRDRTPEFLNTIRSLQNHQSARTVVTKDPRKVKYLQSYAEFMMIARTIGKNISSTYTKLEKLAMLAKKKSLFNDRPTEIQELTYIIKEDLNNLNQHIGRLQDIARNQRQTQNSRSLVSHSSSVVLSLQSKLATMSNEFKQVLEVRTENLKQQRNRQDHFSQGPLASSLPPSAVAGYHQGSVLMADEQVTINLDSAMVPSRSQQQAQAQIYDETDNYLQERAETMQNIESTIVELGGIFQQLAHMVKEQEEMVERIDTNVQDTELNVEAAHGEILKYFQSVTSNRWLMIKIFAVLIFFFIFFVVFLA